MTTQCVTATTLKQKPSDLQNDDSPAKLGRPFSVTNPNMTKQERQNALKHIMSDVYKEYAAYWQTMLQIATRHQSKESRVCQKSSIKGRTCKSELNYDNMFLGFRTEKQRSQFK